MTQPRAYLFDAYGTLFDVNSVIARAGADIAGDLQAVSNLWRRKQLEYTWLRSLMERYVDFWEVTAAALHAAAEQLGIAVTAEQSERLMQAYLTPSAFPDAKPALDLLSGAAMCGRPLAILSNGSPRMLEAAVRHNGLDRYFAEIISADCVRTYKPSPRVYALGEEILKLPASEILFVSSNAWDAAGAKSFGYQVCWCNRSGGQWERLGAAADTTVTSLDQLP
jgi:2-haloacid dehalogenase